MRSQAKQLEQALDQRLIQARKESIRRLNDIEHRLEFVDVIEGVEYINDAKADDANSSWYSIDCMERQVVWIISSCKFETDYSLFYEMDASRVKALVVLGGNQGAVENVFRGRVKTIARAEHMDNALRLAKSFSISGDVVLYSPAFSDMENFTPYKERGQLFRKAVREMQLK
jgi:UDP-N-acetylmuramoylalanine--D-glutamate ligase